MICNITWNCCFNIDCDLFNVYNHIKQTCTIMFSIQISSFMCGLNATINIMNLIDYKMLCDK